MRKYHKSRTFTTDLPCGAAYDCFFEYAYEHFEKEVLANIKDGERKYDAWNQYEKVYLSQKKAYMDSKTLFMMVVKFLLKPFHVLNIMPL